MGSELIILSALLALSVENVEAQQARTELKVLTYNAFLETGGTSRLLQLEARFSDQTFSRAADLICLQEVEWVNDVQVIVAAAKKGGFPHSYSFADDYPVSATDLRGPACPRPIPMSIYPCSAVCADYTEHPRNSSRCLFQNCKSELKASNIPVECLNCIFDQGRQGLGRPQGSGTCFTTANRTRAMYQETNGLVLLSKYPLSDQRAIQFLDRVTLKSRGYLRATVNRSESIGTLTAVCAHLYPDSHGVPYVGTYDSAELENLNNTVAILRDPVVEKSETVIFMGEMEHGPSGDDDTFRNSTDSVVEAGYCNPYILNGGQCTLCRSNPLAVKDMPGLEQHIHDHVYIKSPDVSCTETEVTTRADLTISSSRVNFTDSSGNQLSNHYGVLTTLSYPTASGSAHVAKASMLTAALAVLVPFVLTI